MSAVSIKRLRLDDNTLKQQLRQVTELLGVTTYTTSRLLYAHYMEVVTELGNLRLSLYNRGVLSDELVFIRDSELLTLGLNRYLTTKYPVWLLTHLEVGMSGYISVKDLLFVNYKVNRLRDALTQGKVREGLDLLKVEAFCSDLEGILRYLILLQKLTSIESLLGSSHFIADRRLTFNRGLSLTYLDKSETRFRVPLRFWSKENYLYSAWNGLTTYKGYSYVYDCDYFYDKVIVGVVDYFELYEQALAYKVYDKDLIARFGKVLPELKEKLQSGKGQWVFLKEHLGNRSKESFYLELLYDGRLLSDTEIGQLFGEFRELCFKLYGDLIFQKVLSGLSLSYLIEQLKDIADKRGKEMCYVQHITSFGVFVVSSADVDAMRDLSLPLGVDVDYTLSTEALFSGLCGSYDVEVLVLDDLHKSVPMLREGKICVGIGEDERGYDSYVYLVPNHDLERFKTFVNSVNTRYKRVNDIEVDANYTGGVDVLAMLENHLLGVSDLSELNQYKLLQYGLPKKELVEIYDIVKRKLVRE